MFSNLMNLNLLLYRNILLQSEPKITVHYLEDINKN